MRGVHVILVVSLVGLVPLAGATAQEALTIPDIATPDEGAATLLDEGELSREERLNELFATLGTVTNRNEARAAEREIIELWLDSESDTVNLLMDWTIEAIDNEDFPLALDFLDRITTLRPDYAEGWNKRATVYFLTDELGKSLADIERALAIEPRHFAALSGLGTILREIGDKKRAVEAYERALELDPHLENVQKALEELGEEGEGI